MKRTLLRQIAVVVVLILTISAFIWYFATHPEVRQQLSQIPPFTLVILLLLYLLSVFVLGLTFNATLRLCRLSLNLAETALLTAYSSVINFFGPLQSGPAFRAVYLKQKYKLSITQYTLATLVYYAFFGTFSAMLLLSGILGWWLIVVAIVALAVIFAVSRHPKVAPRVKSLSMGNWYYLAAATLAQVLVVAIIYYVELNSVSPGIEVSQALIYTGAANLALFVSITPGAIGFREAFLLFTQNLHNIDASTIVAANIIDRAMYIVLMLILGLFIIATHAKKKLDVGEELSNDKRIDTDNQTSTEQNN